MENRMAGKVKSSYILKIKLEFAAGDIQIINLDNPRNDLQVSEINEVSQFIKENNLLLGDKYGADSAGILTADKISSTKTTLDL